MNPVFILFIPILYIELRLQLFLNKIKSLNLRFVNHNMKILRRKVFIMEAIIMLYILIILFFEIDISDIKITSFSVMYYFLYNIWIVFVLVVNSTINDFYIVNDKVVFPFGTTIYLNTITSLENNSSQDISNSTYLILIYKNKRKYKINLYHDNVNYFFEVMSKYL